MTLQLSICELCRCSCTTAPTHATMALNTPLVQMEIDCLAKVGPHTSGVSSRTCRYAPWFTLFHCPSFEFVEWIDMNCRCLKLGSLIVLFAFLFPLIRLSWLACGFSFYFWFELSHPGGYLGLYFELFCFELYFFTALRGLPHRRLTSRPARCGAKSSHGLLTIGVQRIVFGTVCA